MKAIGNRVIVRQGKEEAVTASGIVITGVEKPRTGVVLYCGDGAFQNGKLVPIAVKVGDKIMFGKHAGNEVMVDKEVLLVMTEDDVLAVFDE